MGNLPVFATPVRWVTSRVRRLGALLGASAGVAALLGCSHAPPPRPTYGSAVGGPTCQPADARPEVFTLDWNGADRQWLKSVLRPDQYAVVVSYDCQRLRVLDQCRVGSPYKYTGTGVSQDRVFFSDAEQIALGMPLRGATLAVQYGSGWQLWAETTLIGNLTVAKDTATLGDLFTASRESVDGCRGATHFVRRASLGAFDLRANATGSSSAGASIGHLGGATAGSSGTSQSVNGEGSPALCAKAPPGETPLPGCDYGLQLQLVPIQGPPVPEAIDVPGCAPGTVLVGAACTSNPKRRPFLCRFGDLGQCQEQCQAGETKSCNTLGFMHQTGWGIGLADREQARKLYQAACDRKHVKACTNLALLLLGDEGVDRAYPTQLLQWACSAGEGRACTKASELTPLAQVTDPKDPAVWALSLIGARPASQPNDLLLRGCRAGDARACERAAALGLRP